MAYLNDDVRAQVRPLLADLAHEVELKVLTGGTAVAPGHDATGHQEETLGLLHELADLSDKITVTEAALDDDAEAQAAGIDRAPTILFRRKGEHRTDLRFAGLPSGYEFTTLLEAIRLVAANDLPEDKVGALDRPTLLQTFVTPGCPYCPQAVLTAFELALANDDVIAEGVEANEFPVLAQRFRISSVPDTIVGGDAAKRVLGAQPKRQFVEAVQGTTGA
ncbi:MAG: thioredoxin family protein [Trueperaceae bacterium]